MTRNEFESVYSRQKLIDFIAIQSTNQVKKLLKTFSCTKNTDVQDFLHNKAITFERSLRSRTYLYADNTDKSIVAYFSVGITYLLANQLDKSIVKFLDGYTDEVIALPCYLIGQLGKSDKCTEKIGDFLLDDALNCIDKSQEILSGRFVLIDSVNDEKVLDFYRQNSFVEIQKDKNLKSIKMIKPYF